MQQKYNILTVWMKSCQSNPSVWHFSTSLLIKPLKTKKRWVRQSTHWSHIYQTKNENVCPSISARFWLTYPFRDNFLHKKPTKLTPDVYRRNHISPWWCFTSDNALVTYFVPITIMNSAIILSVHVLLFVYRIKISWFLLFIDRNFGSYLFI